MPFAACGPASPPAGAKRGWREITRTREPGMPATVNGHLDYYTRYGINPVRYDMSDLRLHLDRRGSLYRTLGLTPLAIRGARVLEVAPGTGQNSLYLARLAPHSLTLVEPNPVAIRDIAAVYAAPGAAPRAAAGDRVALRGLRTRRSRSTSSSARTGSAVRITNGGCCGSSGRWSRMAACFSSRRSRRWGCCRTSSAVPWRGSSPPPMSHSPSERPGCAAAFGPHLRTLTAMTRGVTDWVHDNMLNPAYFGILLTVPMVLAEFSGAFDVLGSSPRFAADWRWFKGLCGSERDFNRHVLKEYRAGIHNFFDHRAVLPAREPARNAEFETAALTVCRAIREWEERDADGDEIDRAVRRAMSGMADLPGHWSAALDEFLDAFADPHLTAEAVAAMPLFGPLFGRETIYLSFEKRAE